MSEPLIYTSKGNVPLSELTYQTNWDVQDAYIKFTETHRDASGEIVKQSVHVYDRLGVSGAGAVATF